jgi:murein DD-endopeptidase MepM/ murein hydrolase activator NlpD
LEKEIAAAGQEMQQLSQAARAETARRLRHTPRGAPCQGEMTSPFGHRTHPVYGTGRHHNGCDFTTDEGTKIFATADGKVVTSDWLGGYGQAVEIDHGSGLKTLYAHCSRLQVKKGQTVRRGDWIACVGMTGLASGPHCHYEVHLQGKPVDPQTYLPPRQTPGSPPALHERWAGAGVRTAARQGLARISRWILAWQSPPRA